jgi:hypothetical protein
MPQIIKMNLTHLTITQPQAMLKSCKKLDCGTNRTANDAARRSSSSSSSTHHLILRWSILHVMRDVNLLLIYSLLSRCCLYMKMKWNCSEGAARSAAECIRQQERARDLKLKGGKEVSTFPISRRAALFQFMKKRRNEKWTLMWYLR